MPGYGNQALNINNVVGQQANLEITTHGSDWYYTVCAIMGVSTIIIMVLAFKIPQHHRMFHYITAAITAIACIAYFAMGSNLGQVPIQAEFVRPNSRSVRYAGTREIFYARYIDWFVTTPLLLLDLLLTAGVSTPTILITLLINELMIVCGLIGALTRTRFKWGFWTFGTAALFFVAYQLLFVGRRHATALGGAPQKTFLTCGVWLLFIWFLYPIAWGLSEGGNVIHPDSEAIFYGILDIMSKPVFGALLLWGHRNIKPRDLGLHIREPGVTDEKYGHGVPGEGPGPNVGGANIAGASHPATSHPATAGTQNVV
ncbi:FDD123 protein [Biscogniauxia marginata]|nr:FDD123 protein [Biscogniauxia marginata]